MRRITALLGLLLVPTLPAGAQTFTQIPDLEDLVERPGRLQYAQVCVANVDEAMEGRWVVEGRVNFDVQGTVTVTAALMTHASDVVASHIYVDLCIVDATGLAADRLDPTAAPIRRTVEPILREPNPELDRDGEPDHYMELGALRAVPQRSRTP